MNCEEIKKVLPAYQDGELAQSKAADVRVHLAGCPVCQKEEQLLSVSWDLLGTLKSIDPSPDFRTKLWEKIHEQKEPSHLGWQFPRVAFAAAFLGIWVVGVGIGSLWFFNTQQMQKSHFSSQRGDSLMSAESQSMDSVYIKRWEGSVL